MHWTLNNLLKSSGGGACGNANVRAFWRVYPASPPVKRKSQSKSMWGYRTIKSVDSQSCQLGKTKNQRAFRVKGRRLCQCAVNKNTGIPKPNLCVTSYPDVTSRLNVTDSFLLLTCLSRTISSWVLHIWKAKSGRCPSVRTSSRVYSSSSFIQTLASSRRLLLWWRPLSKQAFINIGPLLQMVK